MENLVHYQPEGDSGDGLSSPTPDADEELITRSWSKMREILIFELAGHDERSQAEREDFYADSGLTFQERRQIFADLGMPMPSPAIDPDLVAQYDPNEPYGWWLRVAGREPTEEEIELHAKPVKAFVVNVIGDDEEAQRVLKDGAYDVPHFVEALDRLAVLSDETNRCDEFENLSEFARQTRHVFPDQFAELVDAVSRGKHPLTRGSASFCLPDLADTRPREAVEILQRLLQDFEDPRTATAAMLVYGLEMRPDRMAGKPLSWGQRRSLDKLAIRARTWLEQVNQPGPVGLDPYQPNNY